MVIESPLRQPYNSALEPTAAPLPSTRRFAGVAALAAVQRLGRWPDR